MIVPPGMFICGRPEMPDVQVRRMTRVRNSSSSAPEISIFGAMLGAVGSARTVPGTTICRIWSRALLTTSRDASACALVTVEAVCDPREGDKEKENSPNSHAASQHEHEVKQQHRAVLERHFYEVERLRSYRRF